MLFLLKISLFFFLLNGITKFCNIGIVGSVSFGDEVVFSSVPQNIRCPQLLGGTFWVLDVKFHTQRSLQFLG